MKQIVILHSRLVVSTLLLFALVGAASSCKKTSDTPTSNEVYIENMVFTPSTINVIVNATVTWTNKDGVAHTVTSNSDLFDSGSIPNNGIFSKTFTTVGTFPYHCSFHPSMVGTVVVTASTSGTGY